MQAGGGGSTSSSAPWGPDLDAYLASHPTDTCAAASAERAALVAAVKAAPTCADAWAALLAHEEVQHGSVTAQHGQAQDAGRVSLYHLFVHATKLVPRSKRDAYLALWLGYARTAWPRGQDEARDIFKTLKNQQIGDASAQVYHEWAALEAGAGHVSKALGILAKGLRAGAQPASLLETLRNELQSGTFDVKAAAATLTETITLDASAVAARTYSAVSTPAPPASVGARPGSAMAAAPHSSSRPAASVLGALSAAGAASARGGGGAVMASCLKAPAAAGGAQEHHVARAVTFAADVHDAPQHDGVASHRAGCPSATSSRSSGHTADVHSTCLTSASSLSSRSTASVHDGMLPFSGSVVSYKSSTTESSGMGGVEEDTISCKVEGGAGGRADAGAAAGKTSTAPLSGAAAGQATTPAAGGGHTATIGLKRFGFKSRALRVGGAADAPAAASSQEAGGGAAGRDSSAMATAAAAAAPAGSSAGSSPPEPQASRQQGQQLPGAPAAPVSSSSHQRGSRHDASTPAAAGSQDRGTPAVPNATGRDAHAGLGLWSSPADGQLPSSLETTPSEGVSAAAGTGSMHAAAAGSRTAPRAALADLQPHAGQPGPRPAASDVDRRQQQHPQQQQQPARAAPAAAQPSSTHPARPAHAAEVSPAPTVVLPEPRAAGSRVAAAAAPAATADKPARTQGPAQPQQQQPSGGASHSGRLQPRVQQAGPRPADVPPPSTKPAAAQPRERPQQQQQQQPAAVQQPAQVPQPVAQPQQQQAVPRQPVPPAPHPAVQQPQQQQAASVQQACPKEDAQTVFVQGVRYHKLECVGRGGSSKVFKVMGPGCKIYALKRIRLAGRDAEAASGFIDEINLLNSLRAKPNIIQLVDSQVFTDAGLIYMVQEYGEIDLARLLAKHDAARRAAVGPDGALSDGIDENFVRLYWQQMLQAVAGVHDQRIVHSDLKPANFLLVEGQLKLIDFGIAKAISGDTTSIARESQVGTLNYMSPEAILGGSTNILGGPAMKVGRPSDVWSLGCILYQMVYGRTPFADLPFLPKMHAICNPHHAIKYPPLANADLLDVMRRCLDRDPKSRIGLQELLDHPFLHPKRSQAAAGGQAAAPVLSVEQMKLLVAQVQAAGAAGVTDLDALTRDLMHKLGGGGEGPRAAGA